MSNIETLIPGGYKLSQEEASKGGKASGEARRRKRTMREAAELMMNAKVPEQILEQMRSQGMRKTDNQYIHAVVFAQMARALKGDTRAAQFLAELMGEVIDKIEVTKVDDASLKEMEQFLNGQSASL